MTSSGGTRAAAGSGPGRSGRGSANPPAPSYGLPTAEALLEQVKLREAAARMSDSWVAISESVLARNESALVRWLEERQSRGEESVTLEQFCETLESRDAPREECEEAFGQFDAEGDGIVNVENMLMALKNSNGANRQGELSHVIRQLQACSLTPGFVDIFSKSKDRLKAHASKILKFLHRNRIPSSAIPFPVLEGFNSICTMRSSVVQDFLDYLLQKEKVDLNHDPDVDKVKVVTQCYSFIEASSNSADINKMTNGETVSFWQSDGSARSHWIRLKLKPDIVLRRLAIAVASNDHSYMPQLVSIAVGKSRRSLQEIRDVRIPSNVTGYVPLLDNANISHPYIQINIKRCLSDGCDTRIHGLKTMGYQITKSKEVSVSDASAIWYLSLLTSLVTASMETNPVLAQTVLQSTQKALQHMPPLSLTTSSMEFPKFLSPNILEEVDGFLLRIADCCVSPEAELTLLAFALARGSVAKVLISLSCICEHLDSEYRASSLLASMATVRLRLLYRKPIQLHLQACDVKSKEEKSGPENMLTEPNTGDGFLTENGKRKASVILSTENQKQFGGHTCQSQSQCPLIMFPFFPSALVAKNGQSSLSEDLLQIYALADGTRTWMLEMKQRYLMGKMNGVDEKEDGPNEVTVESLAKICISRSLFLFRFSPSGGTFALPEQEPSRPEDGACAAPLLRSVSTSEGDFQPSPSAPSISQTPEGAEAAATPGASQRDQTFSAPVDAGPSSSISSQGATGSSESLQSQTGEPLSPLVFPRKAPFSRGRLRLLSLRSMEEPRMAPPVKERFPILKHIHSFMKDMVINESSVLHTLALKKAQALSVCEVLELVQQCVLTLGKPHLFQTPCILFLQELLACQKDFTNYFSQLVGSGQEMRELVRHSYHRLVLMLVEAVQGFNALNEKVLLPALSCVQTCLLHLLDMSWEAEDLSLFLDIKLPDLLLTMSQENISVHDIAISQWTEEDEIVDYERNCEWMDECLDGMFEKWFDKISQASAEDKRKMHMFIARYCDLLNVEISCDGCERIAPWHRYRCLQCTDMDLCKTCFLSGAKPEGHEDDHEMVNMEYACDHCQGLIVGSRINCNVCEDFDLCFGCYNAKKYPDSHLPTHRITVYPMVTIRISDRHRLIQPYIHNYSWLLFAALALFTSELVSERSQDGDPLDDVTLGYARALQNHCSDIINECLLKGQTGKGLRASALLSLLSSNESATESELCPATAGSFQDISSTDTSSLPSSTTAICSPPLPRDKVSHCTYYIPEAYGLFIFQVYTVTSATSENMDAYKDQEEKTARGPIQEHVFAECSRERILGLLAAMLPATKQGSSLSLSSLSPILPLLFRVVISNAGCLNETYHLTLGLLGQLLLRISPAEADAAVAEALTDKFELLTLGDGPALDVPGWKTTQLLFSLGAVCLDSRIGLDWACSVADILRNLNVSSQWCAVVAAFTDHCIQQFPQQLKRTNLFTLLVLVGFPEVLCMGTQAVFIDIANEQHNVILLKHFTEKNRAAVVDVKTRKRRAVKDYQLVQAHESSTVSPTSAHLSRYLKNFTSIVSHLLQVGVESSAQDAVEATWVLSLALKGLYNTLKVFTTHLFQTQEAIHGSGLMQLLVRKCSKGTGFSKMWLLRDLEILSIMLYSSKREIHSMAEDADTETDGEKEREKEHDSDHSSCCAEDTDPNRPDPLEGLDEETKICFQITHDALNAPLHILRAMYELQMKRTDSFFLEVQKRFDGDAIKTDETIRTLAQKWQPSKRPHSEERSTKAVDTDIIIVPCVSKPTRCDRVTEETNVVTQKLITNTESDLQLSYAKQRRTKSSALLHKELDARSNKAVRQYLFKVNEAIAILYARHVLATLLADWPSDTPIREEDLELSGASHMAYILDMLMQLEERPLWEKILQKVLRGCSQSMLGNLSLTACQFMEEPGMAVQVRESKHPYDNNTNFEDKVHIPGAIFLSVKFDSRCHTEEGCDELLMASSSDFLQDLHTFSGSHQKWTDFEIPGDTLYYRFISDMSNTEWGYKFTVTGGHRGRFQTGFEILKQMLADKHGLPRLPLADIWEWQVGVACRQTGNQRLKAIHLLLRLLQCPSQWACDLTLLRPLWQLFTNMESGLIQDPTSITVLLPLHRALTELFFIAEAKAMEQDVLQEYLLALTTNEQLVVRTAQALKNIAAISLAINYPNKSTKLLNLST
uniref:Zinc finger, ZZ-type with EF hand domain 1 n=1 Tax=Cyprinus carpio TaxID=7962 RepID=A0A8C2EE56_CYPCA